QLVEEGLAKLDQALAIDPDYEDAMAYENLLFREKAKLAADPAEKQRLTALADEWFDRVLETRKKNILQGKQPRPQSGITVPPPPPPPPPAGAQAGPRAPFEVVQGNLISKPPLQYPPEARAAGIQGVVIIEATIGKDGSIVASRVASGHALLAPAA